nr:hypothetical protein CFP56_25942 [Quercus suber]
MATTICATAGFGRSTSRCLRMHLREPITRSGIVILEDDIRLIFQDTHAELRLRFCWIYIDGFNADWLMTRSWNVAILRKIQKWLWSIAVIRLKEPKTRIGHFVVRRC